VFQNQSGTTPFHPNCANVKENFWDRRLSAKVLTYSTLKYWLNQAPPNRLPLSIENVIPEQNYWGKILILTELSMFGRLKKF
jgi:hypothetical protein